MSKRKKKNNPIPADGVIYRTKIASTLKRFVIFVDSSEMQAVRLGQTLQLNYAKISIRSHVGNSSPALRSGLSGTVCRMQTALRYGTRLYYNYAVETRVLTLDLISVYVIPRLRDGQCYLLMAAGVFAGVASSVSHKGLSKIARGVMNAAKRIYGVFRPAGNCCFSPVVTVRTRLGL